MTPSLRCNSAFIPNVSCPARNFCAAVDGAGGNVVTFDGNGWTAPVNIDSKAANSVSGAVLIFLMSVSCRSATFCVTRDTVGDALPPPVEAVIVRGDSELMRSPSVTLPPS
jgi:hypothetical protein